jgi:GNAT superfamily N-acetyltransferase
VIAGSAEARLVERGLELPSRHALVTIAERPDLWDAMSDHNVAVWPPFMLEDEVPARLWHHLREDFADTQLVLLDEGGAIAAAGNAAPLTWDGSDETLPDGWDAQFERTVEDLQAGRPPNTLGALQIVVDPGRRGTGLAWTMVNAMRALGRSRGYHALIACVRPTAKDRYPLIPIDRYATWTRADGRPFDPWIRLHVRAGGRIVRASPRSMSIRGSVADWERWVGMAFPDSGDFVIPGALAPVVIDRDADLGTYGDPNVWIVHTL